MSLNVAKCNLGKVNLELMLPAVSPSLHMICGGAPLEFAGAEPGRIRTGKFLTNGQEKKKIALMQEETPSELFGYFKELLVEYPRHSKVQALCW